MKTLKLSSVRYLSFFLFLFSLLFASCTKDSASLQEQDGFMTDDSLHYLSTDIENGFLISAPENYSEEEADEWLSQLTLSQVKDLNVEHGKSSEVINQNMSEAEFRQLGCSQWRPAGLHGFPTCQSCGASRNNALLTQVRVYRRYCSGGYVQYIISNQVIRTFCVYVSGC